MSNTTNVKWKKTHWTFDIWHLKFGIPGGSRAGFTLIELLVAITILAIISTVGLTIFARAQIVGRDGRRKDDLRALAAGLELYNQARTPQSYPVGNWTNLTTGVGQLAPTYINQLPRDPTNNSPYIYRYNSATGATYELCVPIENADALNENGVNSTRGICTASTTNKYFHLFNP